MDNPMVTKTYRAYLEVCLLNGIEVTKERIIASTKYLLERISDDKASGIIYGLAETNKFFPRVSEVLEKTRASKESIEDHANNITDTILEKAFSVSQYNKSAKNLFTTEEWFIVQRFGGLEYFNTIKSDEVPTIRAQLRKSCASLVRSGGPLPALPEPSSSGVKKLGNLIDSALVDFTK